MYYKTISLGNVVCSPDLFFIAILPDLKCLKHNVVLYTYIAGIFQGSTIFIDLEVSKKTNFLFSLELCKSSRSGRLDF
jgi:hypothetical protein